jgi:hypothetical protein
MKNTYFPTFSGWLAGLVVLLCTTTTLFSQTRTWTGSSGTDWNNPNNWSFPPAVPNSLSDVIIPNVANNPVISSLNAVAASVIIQPGGELTIASSGQLTVNSPLWGGTAEVAIYNEGVLTNNGIIYSDAVTMDDGIMNLGTLNNNTGATITVDRTFYRGLFNYYGTINNAGTINTGTAANGWMNVGVSNYGTFNNTSGTINIEHSTSIGLANLSGTFTNQATINIGASASVGTIGIINHSGGNIFNNPGGLININRSSQHGIKNFSGGTFTNAATLNIGSLAGVGNNGILNEYFFYNNTGGVININNSAQYGIRNGDNGTFTNAATLNIGALAAVGGYGIGNEFIFNNNAGGQININRSSVCGLLNDYGIFNNAAAITIGGTASPGEQGLTTFNLSTFNNTGTISIERTTTHGVWNSGTFNNSATVTIGNNAATTMTYTLLNDGTFTNETGGTIHLNRATDSGILNYTSFTNAATINIGSTATVGSNGVLNQGTFSNNAGGQLNLDRSTNSGIVNAAGTFANAATINIGNNAASAMTYGIENDAPFSNSGSGQITINRSTTYGIWNDAGTFTNAATLNIGSTTAIGTRCIYNVNSFSNNTGGVINANNASLYGIEHVSGTFTNAATINIGSTSAVGTYGLRNSSTFNNNTGGQIKIDRSTSFGLRNNAGTFTNAATLTIGSLAAVGTTGISNAATIANNAGGIINIDRSTTRGIINVTGTFTNAATINIGNNAASAMTYGIENDAPFTNSGSGQININRSTSYGVWNSAGTFTNAATINFGSTAGVGTRCIYNENIFNNNTGGTINANNASQYGIEHVTGTFTNAATINIGSTAAVGTNGLRNAATFNNNAGGQLNLDRSTGSALLNAAGTFTNVATVTIGNNAASAMSYGIENAVAFTNSGSGQININRSTSGGIWNQSTGTFTNSATLTIGSTAAVGQRCIYNSGTFNNNTGGVINANNSSLYGIEHVSGTFTNTATINIGSLSAVGTYGLRNSSTFNNNTGGQINIDRSTSFGLRNNAGTFTNSATLNIGSLAAVGTTGISNAAVVNNNAGGTINIDRSTVRGIINVTGTFTNAGTLTIGNNAASSMAYGIENDAAFGNSGSGQININRSTSYGVWNSAGTFTNAATLNIGSTAAVGTRCIYNENIFSNNTGGTINANNASQYGIENVTGTFTNAATIHIGSTAAVGTNGLRNAATFNNNAGGQLNLDRSTGSALLNAAGTFTNAATVTIGNNAASAMSYGIENAVAFTNSGSGQININRSTSGGIWNQSTGTFSNSATLTIGSTAAVGQRCIYNTGTFNNNTGGAINANNSSLYGIEHVTGTFTNAATINIGFLSTVGTYGLRNSSTFNNNTGGQIKIDRSTSFGLRNNAGTFTNSATIIIGSLAAVGTTGISNGATIINNAGGTINIDRSTIRGIINVTGTISNAGTLTIGASSASSIAYGIENTATFNNNTSGQININRSTMSGIYASANTFTNQGSITIGALVPVTNLVTANTGTYSNVTGGILKGAGNLAAANFTNAGGTLSPGYSPGKMTFTGDEDFVNNTLIMEVNGTGMAGIDFDQVVVNGAATLGGTLALSINYVPVSGDQVTILSATAISGTFSNVTGLPVDWQVVYTANSVVLTFGSVLPVELTEFSARLLDQTVQLDWRTASEHNNEGFFIERSSDAGQWEDIGFVPGHGTTTLNIYSFLDENPFSLTGGCTGGCVNYYRLRQVDFGGLFDYSDIVSVELDGQEGRPVLFPNPASTEVQVQLPLEFTEGNLAMFDGAGRLVLMQALEARSQTVRLATADLVAGIYFCQIQLDGAVFVERLQIW